jgi:hypothetical protein
MAKRRQRQRRPKEPVATVDYTDDDGNVLTLRQTLSAGTVRKIAQGSKRAATTPDDAWKRREELLFERLVVRWELAGLPLEEQAMLLGRYRMADPETRRWVSRTIAAHREKYLPEL